MARLDCIVQFESHWRSDDVYGILNIKSMEIDAESRKISNRALLNL